MLVPAHEANGTALAQRQIHIAFGNVATFAIERAAFEIISGAELRGIRLVGDDADRAGLRACAVERSLRTCERLDSRDVVHVNVERTLNRRNGHLIEILAHGGLRSRVIAVIAAAHAAKEHTREAGSKALKRQARHELGVIVEVGDMQLFELFRAQRGDAERHVLQILLALLRRDDHVLQYGPLLVLCSAASADS